MTSYLGRFAPSPTGDLHLGGARTALVAWLAARAAGGRFLVRIDDLDPERSVPGAAARILEDLRWLGLAWDEGPGAGGGRGPYAQSQRSELYQQALDDLAGRGIVYECFCSRAEIARAALAPHGNAEEGPRYPGTCAALPEAERAARREGRRAALRFRVPPGVVAFTDAVQGPQRVDVGAATGDFVVRRVDGVASYQLATAVDDAAMGVTEVVRGADLLPSAARQILLLGALGCQAPAYAHVPLLLGPDGQRLAKRHGAVAIRSLRERGASPEIVIGRLAASLGIGPEPGSGAGPGPARPEDLVAGFDLASLPREPTRATWL